MSTGQDNKKEQNLLEKYEKKLKIITTISVGFIVQYISHHISYTVVCSLQYVLRQCSSILVFIVYI